MEVLPHGDHLVLDGTEDELTRVAAALEDLAGEDSDGDGADGRGAAAAAAGRIRRGLDAGATRIAADRDGAAAAVRALRGAGRDGLAAPIADRLDMPSGTDGSRES